MKEKDSYQKFAEDMFGSIEEILQNKESIFSRVKEQDLDEIVTAFSVNVAHLDYADNFRIYPLNQRKEFKEQADSGCCGSWNSQYKCLSGNIYWIGCNYGH
jgi:hypothetical protein